MDIRSILSNTFVAASARGLIGQEGRRCRTPLSSSDWAAGLLRPHSASGHIVRKERCLSHWKLADVSKWRQSGSFSDKGKPVERRGRKASGLRA